MSDLSLQEAPSLICCLNSILSSQSTLKKQPLYHFPPLEDPGIEDQFTFEKPRIKDYLNCCKEFKIVAFNRIKQGLNERSLNLKYYGLNDQQVQGFMLELQNNDLVQELDLSENFLGLNSAQFLSDCLERNFTLTKLNLSGCNLGFEGASKLKEAIGGSYLQELDLSWNGIKDDGFLELNEGLVENTCLVSLNLSRNGLTELSSKALGAFLAENLSLKNLNLSWNSLNTTPCLKDLVKGLLTNDLILNLDLSWNGLSPGVSLRPLFKYLVKTQRLQEMNLSHNLIKAPSVVPLKNALLKNKSLIKLNLEQNPCSPEDVFMLASVLIEKPLKDPLNYLNLSKMCVEKPFKDLQKQIEHCNRTVLAGQVLSDYEIQGPDELDLIFKRINFLCEKPKKKKQKLNFGVFILKLPDKMLIRDDFEDMLKKKKFLKRKFIDKDLLLSLETAFKGKKLKVNCAGLKETYLKYYPNTVLPEINKKKKKTRKV